MQAMYCIPLAREDPAAIPVQLESTRETCKESCMQALHHGVPMVILLLLVEQPWNAAQAAAEGFGIHVDLPMPTQPGLVVKKLLPALRQMLKEDSYAIKAQHISRLMQAERWTPIEQAASRLSMC